MTATGSILMVASTPSFGWSQKHAQAQLGMGLLGVGFLLTVLAQGVATIILIAWLHRARANADALYASPHRLTSGWAVGGWFVPIGNLVIPAIVATDIVKAGNPSGRSIPDGSPGT